MNEVHENCVKVFDHLTCFYQLCLLHLPSFFFLIYTIELIPDDFTVSLKRSYAFKADTPGDQACMGF